jgi:hypothetical protein
VERLNGRLKGHHLGEAEAEQVRRFRVPLEDE